MPWCLRHPSVQIVTDARGVSTCERCERERRLALAKVCPHCGGAVDRQGACAACAFPWWVRALTWLAEHPVAVVLVLAGLALLPVLAGFGDIMEMAEKLRTDPGE